MSLTSLTLGAIGALLIGSAASAAPVVFDDREAFVAATTPEVLVDFNDVDDVGFALNPVTVDNMTFNGIPFPGFPEDEFGASFISTVNVPGWTIDGTQAVTGHTTDEDRMRIDFLSPVNVWGADFIDLATNTTPGFSVLTRLAFFDAEDSLIGKIDVANTAEFEKGFFGIDLDGAEASYLEVVPVSSRFGGDIWTMDNVLYNASRGINPAPVPLPASSLLFLTAAGAFGLLRRTRA